MPRKIALTLEYEGTRYAGFQLQANAPTVQAALEEAVLALTGRLARVNGAGRTDAGVHAIGQVAAFVTDSTLDLERFRQGLNHHLPQDVAVTAAYEVPLDFDPRRHARVRVYRYSLLVTETRSPLRDGHVWGIGQLPDTHAMAQALAYLEGQRNFAPFSRALPDGKSTIRQMHRTMVWREADLVQIEMHANAFLPQQVRRLVGAVLRVGLGKQTLEEFKTLADSGVQSAAHWVAPPQGLCLREVQYERLLLGGYARSTDYTTHAGYRGSAQMARR